MGEEGKFKQPWLGVLALLTVYAISYLTYMVFLNPVGGLLSRLVVADVSVLSQVLPAILAPVYGAAATEMAALLAPALALRSASYSALYPLGYPLDWLTVVVFGIVWFVTIAVLCMPFQRGAPPKQPQSGLAVAAITLILAFLTVYVLSSFFHFTGYELLLLGTAGFLVFPIWATLFHYWPFVPKRATVHPVARGATYAVISWVITFILYYVFNGLAWSGATFFEMYLPGHDLFATLLQPLLPFNHYDQWISLLVAIITGINIMAVINPFEGRSQPTRGVINIIIAIIIGVILWFILMPILGSAPHVFAVPFQGQLAPLIISVRSPGNVTVYLLYVVLLILIIQQLFQMHWFAGKGAKGGVQAVILAFIIGTIAFFITIAYTPIAMALSGASSAAAVSGLQALAYGALMTYANLGMPLTGLTILLETQGTVQLLGTTLTFGWFVLGSIMWLLIYMAFDFWPWK